MAVAVGKLDRRTVLTLVFGVVAILLMRFWFSADRGVNVVAAAETAPQAEKRLERLRQIAATVPGKEVVFKQVAGELAEREKGVIKADTEAQARAQLYELTSNVARANGIETHGMEEYRSKPLTPDYAEVSVAVSFSCAIEQLVNFMAALANQPQTLATSDVRISGGKDKKKNIQVRLSVAGLIPRKLLPVEKKGAAAF